MKICILGNTKENYSWMVLTLRDGFSKLGHEVIELDYKSNSIETIENFLWKNKPDIIFTHLTFHKHHPIEDMLSIFEELRNYNDTKIIHALNDGRHIPRYMDDISYSFDLALVGQTEHINEFSDIWKIPCYYWPYSSLTYNKIATPSPKLLFKNPIFLGSELSHKDRREYIQHLKRVLPIRIVGTKSSNDLRHKTPELSASASCILGLCTAYDINHFIDVRPFQYLGTGACMIIRKFKGMDDVIPPNLYYPFNSYKNPMEIKVIFNKIQKTDTMPMRRKAFNFIQKYHSSVVRMENTLKVIQGKQNSVKAFLSEI